MPDINLLGHEEDNTGKKKKSSPKNQPMTDPERERLSGPAVEREGVFSFVRKLFGGGQKPSVKKSPPAPPPKPPKAEKMPSQKKQKRTPSAPQVMTDPSAEREQTSNNVRPIHAKQQQPVQRASAPLQQILRGERVTVPEPSRKSAQPQAPQTLPTSGRKQSPLRPRPQVARTMPPAYHGGRDSESPDLLDAQLAAPKGGAAIHPSRRATQNNEKLTEAQSPNGGGIDVNLIPEASESPFEPIERVRRVGIILIVNVVIVIVGYAGLVLYEAGLVRETQNLDTQLEALQTQVSSFAETRERAEKISNHIAGVSYLLDHHTEWTNVFGILEDYTLPTVYYSSMTADVGGKMTLAAVAPDYSAVTDQLRVFQAHPEIFESVEITEVQSTTVEQVVESEEGEQEDLEEVTEEETVSVPKVTFGIELSLQPDLIYAYSP